MSYTPIIWYNFSLPVVMPPGLSIATTSMAWQAVGGCSQAQITATLPSVDAKPDPLYELLNMLRRPVVIENEKAWPAWWGYVNSVTVNDGAISKTASLDTMYNSVKVLYTKAGTQYTTTAATDTESIAFFGTKEILESGNEMSDAAAIQKGAVKLALSRKAQILPGRSIAPNTATIECSGWYNTLDWKYVTVAAGADVDTTALINTIVTNCGQFITAIDIDATSGVSTIIERIGQNTALYEAEALLNIGTTASLRLLANVDQNRRLRIYPEPQPTTISYLQRKDGTLIYPQGAQALPGNNIAGTWCKDADAKPLRVDQYHLTDPSTYFIESVQWDSMQGLTFTPRGAPVISDILMAGDVGKLLKALQPYL